MTDHKGHRHSHDDHKVFQDEDDINDPFLLQYRAIRSLLVEKGIVDPNRLRAAVERMEQAGPHIGASAIGAAWHDEDFKTLLVSDPKAAFARLGHVAEEELVVVENTPDLHNIIVCTLCSCYPRSILGQPPAWYVSRSYRTRAVREPRAVLSEFGLNVPDRTQIRVHDSNADMRYLVLPMKPAGTDGWSAEQLTDLVTRDCMVGTALPQTG